MNILHDVKLTNEEILAGVYFIRYQIPVRNKNGAILMYFNDCIKCFDKFDNEVLNKDFTNSQIIKIYNQDTNEDYTETLTEKYKKVAELLGYYPSVPYVRETVRLQ